MRSLCEVEEERGTENGALPSRTGFEGGVRMERTAQNLKGSTEGLWKDHTRKPSLRWERWGQQRQSLPLKDFAKERVLVSSNLLWLFESGSLITSSKSPDRWCNLPKIMLSRYVRARTSPQGSWPPVFLKCALTWNWESVGNWRKFKEENKHFSVYTHLLE